MTVFIDGHTDVLAFCLRLTRNARRQVHLDSFHVYLAQAHHHETGEQKEHDVDQRDDLDPRFFVRNRRAYAHGNSSIWRTGLPKRVRSSRSLRRDVLRLNHHFQISSRCLQLELQVRHAGSEKVKRNQSEDGNAKTARRGDERLGDTAGDRLDSELFVTEKTERPDKTRNRAQQTEQRGKRNECVHHNEKPAGTLDLDTGSDLQRTLQ